MEYLMEYSRNMCVYIYTYYIYTVMEYTGKQFDVSEHRVYIPMIVGCSFC